MVAKKKAVAVADPVIVVDELVMDKGRFEVIPLNLIRISKTNRKHFDQLKLTELAASIKDMGVAQPILIRPVTPTSEEPEIYEIVAGERRFRASIIAGAETIPAMVRVLTDLQAAKIQILENLQREDPHELEEALGYQALMLSHGYNADQLAGELKKSRSYIYGRLKLCALAEPLHKDFLDRKFSASTALLVARIPVPELQIRAMAEITKPNWNGDIPSFREAKNILQSRYMLDLDKATFDIKDAKLLASAGNCVKCPKRTGNQPEIFTDISENICTDPDCFDQKGAALNYRKIDSANKKGIPVIEGSDAAKYAREHARENGEVTLENNGWSFDRIKDSARNKRAADMISQSDMPTPVRVLVLQDGKVIELFKRETVQALLEKTGHAFTEEEEAALEHEGNRQPPSDAYLLKQEEDRILEQRVEKENKFRYHLYRIVREKALIEAGTPISIMLTAMAKNLLQDYRVPDVELKEFYPTLPPASDDDAFEYLEQNQDKALQFMLDIIVGNGIEANKWSIEDQDDGFDQLVLFGKSVGIDAAQVRKDFENPVDATPVKRPLITLKKTAAVGISEGNISSFKQANPNEAWPFSTPKTETAGVA